MKFLIFLFGLTTLFAGDALSNEKPLQKAIEIPLQKRATPKQILIQVPLKKTEEIPSSYSFYDEKLKHNSWLVFKQPKFGKEGVDQMFVFDEEKKANKVVYRKKQSFISSSIGFNVRLFYLNSKTKKGLVLDAGNNILHAFPNGFDGEQMFTQAFTEFRHASHVIDYNNTYVDDRGFLRVIQQDGDYDGESILLSGQSSWLWSGREWKHSNDEEISALTR